VSAAATGWVFEHSPYIGAAFALHLALADVANDAHGNELWMSVPTMARKARLSERHVRRGLARMVQDGMLEVVSREAGKSACYRVLTPADPGHHVTPDSTSPLTGSASTPDIPYPQTPDTVSAYPKEGKNPRDPKRRRGSMSRVDHRSAARPPPAAAVRDHARKATRP
jgi:hypothetical protein